MSWTPVEDEGGALERTAMAWLRTSSALLLAAAVVLRSLAPHHLRPGAVAVSAGLAALSLATGGYGVLRYRRIRATASWPGAAARAAMRLTGFGTGAVALAALVVMAVEGRR